MNKHVYNTEIQNLMVKAITYSDEGLLKMALRRYKCESLKVNDAIVLHHAAALGKEREVNLLLKAGLCATALNEIGVSALDVCLIEMRNEVGQEIDAWLKIANKLSLRATQRSKFTVSLLKLQKDPRVSQQLSKTVCTPPMLLTQCLHKLRRSNIPAMLESRFLIRKADRCSDDETEFNSNFISEVNRKERKRKRKNSVQRILAQNQPCNLTIQTQSWNSFNDALAKRRKINSNILPDFVELKAY
jgi:hypothetical protein